MKPGERISLIKKLAASMAEISPDEVQLMLRQFGLGYNTRLDERLIFDGFASAVASIEDAADETLLALHEHLFGHAAPSPSVVPSAAVAGVWEPDRLRLFVSHTHPNKQSAGILKFGLAYRGIDAFVAHDDIEPSREWQGEIETALATCDAITTLLTPDFSASRWTDQEVGFAVGRSILVIPINLGLNPYGFIGKYQSLMGVGKGMDVLAEEIVDIIAASDLTGTRFIGPAVRAFTMAGSFNDARLRYKTLTRLPTVAWPDQVLDELARAAVENDQISEAVYEREPMPELLAEFIAQRRQSVHF